MMVIENKFDIGDFVYLATDVEQLVRVVTSIQVKQGGLFYELSCGIESSWNYDFEMTKEKNILIDG